MKPVGVKISVFKKKKTMMKSNTLLKNDMTITTKYNVKCTAMKENGVTLCYAQRMIYRNTKWWDEQLPTLKSFYFRALLPELSCPRYGKGTIREPPAM